VKVWEKIYKAIDNRIEEEDRAFELAYLRFGEARKWIVEQINLNPHWLVLEIGYGQGYLTMELASALNAGQVLGIDLLHERITTGATRWIASQVGMDEKITLLASDSTKLPFKEESFDAVASFLALQDIKSTKQNEGVLATIDEACRVAKKNGTVAIADDSFPCCSPKGDQGKLFDAIKQYWHITLPSTEKVIERMKENGISQVKVLSYDPKESLPPKDAERELRLSVKWAEEAFGHFGPFEVRVDFDNFWKDVSEIVKKEGRVFSQIILLLGIKA
jgi:ubiquinone/menaquinone biosynthesis C-methylase UbiE